MIDPFSLYYSDDNKKNTSNNAVVIIRTSSYKKRSPVSRPLSCLQYFNGIAVSQKEYTQIHL